MRACLCTHMTMNVWSFKRESPTALLTHLSHLHSHMHGPSLVASQSQTDQERSVTVVMACVAVIVTFLESCKSGYSVGNTVAVV